MGFFSRLGWGAVLVALSSGGAWAGPHAYGVLLTHLDPQLEYSPGVDPEGLSDLDDCEDAITRGEVNPEKAQVWYVLASFHDSPGPVKLGAVDFGFGDYDGSKIEFAGFGPCNEGFLTISSDGWPGPSEGAVVAYQFPRRTTIVEVYWFASYVYEPVTVPLDVDPMNDTGEFVDIPDVFPPNEDEIWDFGVMGFGEDGYNPCGSTLREGACCLGDECRVQTREQCELDGGAYQGDNTSCFPNPCSSIETSWGRLKEIYR